MNEEELKRAILVLDLVQQLMLNQLSFSLIIDRKRSLNNSTKILKN